MLFWLVAAGHGWYRCVYVVLCCLGLVSPVLGWFRYVLFGSSRPASLFSMVSCGLGLVSASLDCLAAVLCYFMFYLAGLGWSRCVLNWFLLFGQRKMHFRPIHFLGSFGPTNNSCYSTIGITDSCLE